MLRDYIKEITEDVFNDILNKDATGIPVKLSVQGKDKVFTHDLTALVSDSEDTFIRMDATEMKDTKICKIFVSDLEELNSANPDFRIPTPPYSLKSKNATVFINKGNEYKIVKESFEGFNQRLIVLEIEKIS